MYGNEKGGISMGYSNGIITAPVSIYDVQRAIGASSPDLGTLCRHANINKWAKYKPVRSSVISVMTDADFIAAGYGLSAPAAFYANTQNPDATWQYLKPRTNDWARLSDFNNYAHNCICPFGFEVSGELGSIVGIVLYTNSGANIITPSDRSWQGERNLSVADILTANGFGDYYLGFCIHDLTDQASAYVAIVTNKKLSTINDSVEVFLLYSEQKSEGGLTYPAIPLIADKLRDGHTYRYITCLFSSGPDSGYAYQINPYTPLVYPLAFEAGIDRHDIEMHKANYIAGLQATLSISNVTWTYVGTTTVGSSTMDEYTLSCTIKGTFVTPSNWNVQHSVGVDVTINNPYGYAGSDTYQETGYVSIPNSSTTYSNVQILNISGLSVKWFSGVPANVRSVIVSAAATYSGENVPFNNTVEIKLN
jgi:hypothetical protein